MDIRPDPKELLKYVQTEEQKERQGKLKIYLGMAPGVGKTYAMLEDGIEKLGQGLDVVAGIVETHGRKETDALLKKFEILPRATVDYRGKKLEEFDLDAALKRHPALILVDEMAHTNVPGTRHNKRWLDIFELLDRGIDVHTTLNVQHIESLNNVISQITSIVIRETVPDTVLEKASAIELIDLTPDDLLKRLEEGKVYVPDEVGAAISHFFRKSNLTALRELALRITAEQVNAEVLLHRKGESSEKIWPTTERLLVCIGPGPNAPRHIRTTYRMAKSLHAEWFAIYVERPDVRLSEEDNHRLIQNLHLAEQLGGETHIIEGVNLVKEIINFAHNRNITKIILGKIIRSRFIEFFKRSLADELVRESINIDLYILRGDPEVTVSTKRGIQKSTAPKLLYITSIVTVAICTGINYLLSPYIDKSTILMVYFLGVIFVSAQGYFGPSFITSILSVLAFGLLFTSPQFGFSATDIQDLITITIMLLVTQVIARYIILTGQQAEFAQLREQRIVAQHLLSKQLARQRGVQQILEISSTLIAKFFNSEVVTLIANKKRELIPIFTPTSNQVLTEKELSVAKWVFEMEQMAGFGTTTLPDNEAIYLPLIGSKGILGILRVQPTDRTRLLIPEQLHLLEGFATQVAMALEVDTLHEEAKVSELEIETDRVRNVLLKYMAANMRLPLTDIMTDAEGLIEIGEQLKLDPMLALGNRIYDNTEELNHLINNLTQITRLEKPGVIPIKKPHTLYKIVQDALQRLSRRLEKRQVTLHALENLPKIICSKVFLEQVFFNIIENAIKYTPADSPISISAILETERVIISIEDKGPGVPLDEINKIFEKFYRGQTITDIKGMGLGLAICQKVITLHGGEIWAVNSPTGGAIFRFTLPLNPVE